MVIFLSRSLFTCWNSSQFSKSKAKKDSKSAIFVVVRFQPHVNFHKCPFSLILGNCLKEMQEEHEDELLVCEGYLKKLRGFGRSRKRWFRLTKARLCFYTKHGGAMISSCWRRDILIVAEKGPRLITITTSVPFGASQQSSMLLEAPSNAVKTKWFDCLKQDVDSITPHSYADGVLLIESYLTKLQPIGSISRSRWFTLTSKFFSYFTGSSRPPHAYD